MTHQRKMSQLEFIDTNNFYFSNDTVKKMTVHYLGKHIFKYVYYKGLLTRIHKELLKFSNKKTRDTIF